MLMAKLQTTPLSHFILEKQQLQKTPPQKKQTNKQTKKKKTETKNRRLNADVALRGQQSVLSSKPPWKLQMAKWTL